MRKRILILMGATMCVMAWCGAKKDIIAQNVSILEQREIDINQIPNPWTDCKILEEAEQNAGFSIDIPDRIGEYSMSIIQDLNNEIIRVFYKKVDEDNNILIRKGIGSDDISGDHNKYDEINEVHIDDQIVIEKENGEVIYLATWISNNYSYSVSIPRITEEEMTSIIHQIN